MNEPTPVKLKHHFRLAKQDDEGCYTEFICFEAIDNVVVSSVIVTPDSDPQEFERLVALEQEERHKDPSRTVDEDL
jgi:hypothetical protein